MEFINMETLLDKIRLLISELEFYENKSRKIRPVPFDIDQIGYPCGLRKRIIRRISYED